MKLTVTYAGLPFQQIDAELASRLARYMPPDHLPDVMPTRADWPGPNLLGLGLPMPPAPPLEIGLGCLWYPWGMSRHAVYRGVMTAADVTALGAIVAGAPTDPQTFRAVQTPGTRTFTLETPLHVLPPRPCVEDGLYLVTLVDDRFFRAGRGAGKIRPDGTLTWGSLITALATALGITLTSASVDAAYFKPEPDSPLYSSEESAAALLDAVAANVGRVVVRNLDGTYKLEAYADGNTAAASGRSDVAGNRLARLWGGAILPTDPAGASNFRSPAVPASVLVTFPKWVTGSGYYEPSTYRQYRKDSYGDVYEKTVTLADLGSPYSGWAAGAGKKVIRVTAKAEFVDAAAALLGTSPTNATDLTTLAQRQAKDFYDGTAAALDETYSGMVGGPANGATDAVWCLRRGEVWTRVVRRPWEWGSSERQLCITARSIPTSPPPPPGTLTTVYAIADLGGSPPTYTVRQVHRNGAGALVDDTGPVDVTAYEAQDRPAFIDTPGVPTREYPLFTDSNGKAYFQIDQYADGLVTPALAGHVSTSDQTFKGIKRFADTVYCEDDLEVTDSIGVGFAGGDHLTITASAGNIGFTHAHPPSSYGFGPRFDLYRLQHWDGVQSDPNIDTLGVLTPCFHQSYGAYAVTCFPNGPGFPAETAVGIDKVIPGADGIGYEVMGGIVVRTTASPNGGAGGGAGLGGFGFGGFPVPVVAGIVGLGGGGGDGFGSHADGTSDLTDSEG